MTTVHIQNTVAGHSVPRLYAVVAERVPSATGGTC